MTERNHTYQAMFLLDNGEVREQGFNAVRQWVKDLLEKHGATVKVLRLWGERPLAYPIQGRARATYLLGWIEGEERTVSRAKHEMYLMGPVFRSLFLKEDEIPAEELSIGIEEVDEAALDIPDDTPVREQLFEDEEEGSDSEDDKKSDEKGEGGDEDESSDDEKASDKSGDDDQGGKESADTDKKASAAQKD